MFTALSTALLLCFIQLVAAAPQDAASLSRRNPIESRGEYWANEKLYSTVFPNVTWDATNWILTSTVLDQGHYQSRGSIANGYIGINVASAGPFFELDTPVDGDVINGWPLFSRRQTFCTVAGFWDEQPTTNGTNFAWLNQYGGESVISGIPHWGGLIFETSTGHYLDAAVDNTTITDYQTVYNYRQGTLSWSYTWSPTVDESYDITFLIFANKLQINQGVVQMTIQPSINCTGSIINLLEGYAAVRTNFVESGQDGQAIYSAVQPMGIDNVTAYIYAVMDAEESADMSNATLITDKPYILPNASTIAQSANISLQAGQSISITKYVGIASTDSFPDPQSIAREACWSAYQSGFASNLQDHTGEWASIMPADSVDDFTLANGSLPDDEYIVESAIMAVVNPYYLLQNTIGPNALDLVNSSTVNDFSISVGGLTSDSYGGMVFWDADVWMQPGLVTAFPESARRTSNYRLRTYPQAKENVKTKFTSSKNATYFSDEAALYSWTSGRYGNCTGTGPCFDYEYHLNGDIGLSLVNQYLASGDQQSFQDDYFPLYNSVATSFSDLIQPNGSKWTLTNMTDPDEYYNDANAGAYTMALIAQTLSYANGFRQQLGLAQNDTWNSQAANVLLIRENNITLEYTMMNNSIIVKQADVILQTFPLDYTRNYAPNQALDDVDYYALKQSPNGPGMTYAIFAIDANEVSQSGCAAYTYQQYSYSPYIRAPFHQFSEQIDDDYTTNGGTHPAFPFLTGHGGANQVVIFGYLGLRYLPTIDAIHIDPALPPQIPQVKYRTFYWQGWPISAWSNQTHTTVERCAAKSPLSTANWKYNNSDIALQVGDGASNYSLPADGTAVVIPNRQPSNVNTLNGNIVQCQPVSSPDAFQPGQFPFSVNDGAASTNWQPLAADQPASVVIKVPDEAVGSMVKGFYFDWASAPPTNISVVFSNSSSLQGDVVVSSAINISVPYTADSVAVELPTGNSTNLTLPSPIAATEYVTLFIQGNQQNSTDIGGPGATVAEWAVLST